MSGGPRYEGKERGKESIGELGRETRQKRLSRGARSGRLWSLADFQPVWRPVLCSVFGNKEHFSAPSHLS